MSFFDWGKKKGNWEIDPDKNIISRDDGYSAVVSEFFPEEKRFKSSHTFRLQSGTTYTCEMYEYKISSSPNPTEVHVRLMDFSEGLSPNNRYSVRDGVVLENEIARDRIKGFQKEILWKKVELSDGGSRTHGYAQLFFILSKHPEIVSKAEYVDFLNKIHRRIAAGLGNIHEALKKDKEMGSLFEIVNESNGQIITYRNFRNYRGAPKDAFSILLFTGIMLPVAIPPSLSKDKKSYLENLLKKFEDSVYDENSTEYSGISKHEFYSCIEILSHIDQLLKKEV